MSIPDLQDFYTYACGIFEKKTTVTWISPRMRTNPDVVYQKYLSGITGK